jgi:hypothetical protein
MTISGRPKAASAAPSSKRPPSEALMRFRRGEISLSEYLETRVEAAVEHLRGRVSSEQLETVREVLRESLASDPAVLERMRYLVSDVSAAELNS